MEKYIKYKRIVKKFETKDLESNLQEFFDELIKDGWEIIYYNEKHNEVAIANVYLSNFEIILVVGKKQSNVL
jgi:hypothetical protein